MVELMEFILPTIIKIDGAMPGLMTTGVFQTDDKELTISTPRCLRDAVTVFAVNRGEAAVT